MEGRVNHARLGILFVLVGMICISFNDMLIKRLSGDYALHQIVFARSGIGIIFSLMIVHWEGGLRLLRTDKPYWHAGRGMLLVIANMTFFAAIAVLPLAEATALFFAAPIFITLLSIPILGEKIGPLRFGAVLVGFLGIIIMQRPWASSEALEVSRIVLLLPVVAAITYALTQILTRKLGGQSSASAMSVYVQIAFLAVSILSYLLVGDGRFATNIENTSLVFLLRAWVWPSSSDWWIFLTLGLNSAAIGYALSAAYKVADAATVAPFEYVGLPLAVMWGYLFFGDIPAAEVWIGIALIVGSGLFVFLREQQKTKRTLRGKIEDH